MNYATLVSTVGGLTIAGIARQYDHEPNALDLSDGPASYVRLPRGEYEPIGCVDSHITRSVDLVVAVESGGQEMTAQNFSDTVEMLDNVTAAIKNEPTLERASYTITAQSPLMVDGALFFNVVATITITGDY